MGIAGVGAYNGVSTYYSNTASKKESLSDAIKDFEETHKISA